MKDVQKQQNQDKDKFLSRLEIVLMIVGMAIFLALVMLSAFLDIPSWLRIVLVLIGLVEFIPLGAVAILIEQKTGCYECQACHHQYVPTYHQVCWSAHLGRTRYMKCPKCGKKTWQKKVL